MNDTVAHPARDKGRHVTGRDPLASRTPASERLAGVKVVAERAEHGDGHYRAGWLTWRSTLCAMFAQIRAGPLAGWGLPLSARTTSDRVRRQTTT